MAMFVCDEYIYNDSDTQQTASSKSNNEINYEENVYVRSLPEIWNSGLNEVFPSPIQHSVLQPHCPLRVSHLNVTYSKLNIVSCENILDVIDKFGSQSYLSNCYITYYYLKLFFYNFVYYHFIQGKLWLR